MRSVKALLAGLSLFSALCSLSSAAELTIQGVNRAECWVYGLPFAKDSTDWATHLEDKLDLNLRYGDLRGALGGFLYEPSKPWTADQQPLHLLDYTIAYSPKQLEILYGKFFQTFGKGLALSTYADDDFRHYKSLNGLRGIARLPLKTEVVLLGGHMRDLFFQENTYKIMNADSAHADTSDQVMGVNLESRPLSFAGIGGRYVRVNRTQDPTPKAFTELFGGDLTAKAGPAELYGEICQRLGTKPYVGGREKGLGYLLTGTVSVGSFSALGEYMDYDSIGFPDVVLAGRKTYRYTDPPTPILSGVAINRGIDERGYGVTVSGTPVGPMYVEGVLGSEIAPHDSTARVVEDEAKVRYSLGSNWTLQGTYDYMVQKNIELHVVARATDKPGVQLNYLVGQHSFVLEAEYNFVAEDTGGGVPPLNYHETAIALTYGYGADLLFTAGWQYVDMKLNRRYNGGQSWPVFEAVWSITNRNMLRVRVGAERGGYTCSGGVCREEEPFTGIKATLISRF